MTGKLTPLQLHLDVLQKRLDYLDAEINQDVLYTVEGMIRIRAEAAAIRWALSVLISYVLDKE